MSDEPRQPAKAFSRYSRLAILSVLLIVNREGSRRHGKNGSKPRKLFEALEADQDGRSEDALRLVREARQVEPTDHELALHEATFLWNLGRTEESLMAYAEAARLAPPTSGTASYWHAVRLARLDRDDEGLKCLIEALAREPTLIGEITHDELFARWNNDPAYEAAIEEAVWRALDQEADPAKRYHN